MKKKICLLSTNRAEYDYLFWLYKSLKKEKKFDISFFLTGAHLSEKFGNTYQRSLDDQIANKRYVKIKMLGDDLKDISETFSDALYKFTKIFKNYRPNLLIVIGDRFELLAVTMAASLNKIPIAHLNGGETTQGAQDEWIRHSITKISNLHFVANNDYKRRVIQLGENPQSVYTVGGLSSDNVKKTKLYNKIELEKILKTTIYKKTLLIAYHPETLSSQSSSKSFKKILNVLDKFKNTQIFFTGPNNDQGNKVINEMIKSFIKKNKNSFFFYNLGRKKYLSLLNLVDLIVGNSSSGILEAPYTKTFTLNLGDRQKGRKMAKSVFNCKIDEIAIFRNIKKILNKKNYNKYFHNLNSFYGNGKTSENVAQILKSHKLNFDFKKKFYDLNYNDKKK